MSQFYESGGQSIGVSASGSLFAMNIQDWFPLGWTDLISLSPRDFFNTKTWVQVFFNTSLKASILWCSAFFMVQLSHPHVTTGKTIAFTRQTFVSKVMSLLFKILSRLVIAFFPRSRCLLISWLVVTICNDFGAPKNKVSHSLHCFPIYLPWSYETGSHNIHFLNVEFSASFFTLFSLSSRGSWVPLHFLP